VLFRSVDEKIAKPIVLGDPEQIARVAKDAEITLQGIPVINPRTAADRERYAQSLWQKRQRKGMTLGSARRLIEHPHYFSSMMVAEGDADAMVGGIEQFYPDKLHAPLQAIGVDPTAKALAGIFMMVVEKNVYFVADTTVNVDPDAQTLAHIASETARLVTRLGVTPRVAFLSFSNFGGARFPATEKVAQAVQLLRERNLSDKIKVIAYYFTPGVYENIKAGRVLAAPTDSAVVQGRVSVDQAVRILEGKPYLKHVGPKIYVIDKSNINSFDYASSLAPADWKPVFTVN
jgi:phosphotransacetylase